MRYETVQKLNDEDFKRCTGVQRSTFEQMLAVAVAGLRNFGRPTTLSRADQLLMTLMYWREYRTEFHIGLTYGVSESTVCRTIQKVENTLIQSKQFHLPGKKALQPSNTIFEIVLVDATEQPIERPKKTKTALQRQKEATYPKAQLMADLNTKQILATDFCHGSCHDFQLFKQSRSIVAERICILADAGYQGLASLHSNSQTPAKKSKLHPLRAEQKIANRKLSKKRILIENIIRKLKIFRILSERYRNRRKRFGLRFNLIAAIYNLELKPAP